MNDSHGKINYCHCAVLTNDELFKICVRGVMKSYWP